MTKRLDFIGIIAIGAALAVPLAYGLATLLGMTHKQFRPILRLKRPDGTAVPILDGPSEATAGRQQPDHEQPRRYPW